MRRSVIALLLASVAPISVARAAPPEAAPPPEAAQEDEAKTAARLEVRAGSEAFQAGDYQSAIDHYEAAIALRPAPKLHYNIAVCHQRLSLSADTPEERTRQGDLAIDHYNAYLEQNPQAEDRLEVAQTIRDLGGTPVTMPGLKPLFEGEQPEPDDVENEETGEPPADPPIDPAPVPPAEPPPKPPAYPNHGRFGVSLLGGFSPGLSKAKAVDARGLFAVDFYGGGFVGQRRRFLLAAQAGLFTGATLNPDGLSFYGYSLGLLGQQTWALGGTVGREVVQIGFGGLAALTGQGMNERENVPPPLCSLTDRGAQIANRTGALFASRFDLGILMGARRRGMIGLLVQPSFAVFGDGRTAAACQDDETPWTVLGIHRRYQFQLWVGAGFGLRF